MARGRRRRRTGRFKRRRFGLHRRGRRVGRSFRSVRRKVKLHDKLFERKYYYTSGSSNALATGFSIAAPYQLTQGTGVSSRLGNRIFLKTITLRVNIAAAPGATWNPGTTEPFRQFRVVALLQRHPNNAGTLVPAEILQDASSNDARNLSPFQRERSGKVFKTLLDKRFTLWLDSDNVGLPTGHGPASRVSKWVFKINRTVVFDANTGNTQDITSNLFQIDFWQNYGVNTDFGLSYSMIFSYVDA